MDTKEEGTEGLVHAIELFSRSAYCYAVAGEIASRGGSWTRNGLGRVWWREGYRHELAGVEALLFALGGRGTRRAGGGMIPHKAGADGPTPRAVVVRAEEITRAVRVGCGFLPTIRFASALRRFAKTSTWQELARRAAERPGPAAELADRVFLDQDEISPARMLELSADHRAGWGVSDSPRARYERTVAELKADDTLTPEDYARLVQEAWDACERELLDEHPDTTESLDHPAGWDEDGDTIGAGIGEFFDPAAAIDEDTTKEDTNR